MRCGARAVIFLMSTQAIAPALQSSLQATRKRAANLPAGSTVHGGPWRHEMRSEMGQCPRTLLDEISREHPIVLFDTSQHVAWANTFAIKQAGLGGIPDDIKGGVIERSETDRQAASSPKAP